MLPVVRYREYPPSEPLQGVVRAFFTFAAPVANEPLDRPIAREVAFAAGDSFCSPLFADAHASLVFNFSKACRADGIWIPISAAPHADLIGPMTRVGTCSLAERPEMAGVYFRSASLFPLTGAPVSELTDCIIGLETFWGAAAFDLAEELGHTHPEIARVRMLETVLLQRMAKAHGPAGTIDIAGLSRWALHRRGQLTVDRLAEAAGVSRQQLTRVFRRTVGVTPKLYCRLARFQATLGYAGCGGAPDWARVATEAGYADQSHMIADFRRFSSLTPGSLVQERRFHPFIERAQRAAHLPQSAHRRTRAGTRG